MQVQFIIIHIQVQREQQIKEVQVEMVMAAALFLEEEEVVELLPLEQPQVVAEGV